MPSPFSSSMPTLEFRFHIPQGGSHRNLEAFLLALDGIAVDIERVDGVDDNDGLRWLEYVLRFTTNLLHVLRIPYFESIKVLVCQRAGGIDNGWVAVCQIPNSALVSNQVMDNVLSTVLKLAEWAGQINAPTPMIFEQFFKTIETSVLAPSRSTASGGKSVFHILRVANELGISYFPLPNGSFQMGWGCNARRIDASSTDRDSALGRAYAGNKLSTAHILRKAGLPAPVHVGVASLVDAQRAAQRIGFPVVIKPVDLERGVGVTVDVTLTSLEAAFNDALTHSAAKIVLVEKQVSGVCYRLFVVAGKLLYAVRRLPIGVYGDGYSSISALVGREVASQLKLPPWKRSTMLPLDALALASLSRQGWHPASVPAAGQFIALRRIESTAWGGIDEDVTHTLHPDNVNAAITAASAIGLEVAGVDLISSDIEQPWHSNGAIINEVNFKPLLGEGEVSRGYIPEYLTRILGNFGKIPIHVYVGRDSEPSPGVERWRQLCASGVGAFLIDREQVLGPFMEKITLASPKLLARTQAMLMRNDVQALIVIAPTEVEAAKINAFVKTSHDNSTSNASFDIEK